MTDRVRSMTPSCLTRAVRGRGAGLLLLAILAAAGCHGDAGEGEAEATPPVVRVRTARATRTSFARTVNALGTVAPRPGHVAALSAPAATRVAHIFVSPGQRVARGAPLVELERAPFDAAARSAETALATAQHGYDRAKRLTDAGILPRKELDQAANELAQAQAAAVSARREQQLATLRAPIAGVVTRMTAELSAPVEANQTLVEIADPAALDLLFALSPADAALAHAGDSVAVWAGQDARGQPLGAAVVTTVGAVVDSADRNVTVRARLEHPDRPLRIGETIFGRITVARHAGAVVVPTEALVPDGEGFRLFVVDASGIAHARPVTVGGRTEALAEIVKGLDGGETVVTYGAYGVEDSARVVPMNDRPADSTVRPTATPAGPAGA